MLRENERSLNKLRKENIKLVKEADFYVKPEKATGVSFLAEYRDSHSVEKNGREVEEKILQWMEREDCLIQNFLFKHQKI